MIRLIEELTITAWPSLQTIYYDGWVMRFAEGYTRRSNSISPIYHSTIDPLDKLHNCERIYATKGQATIFKITSDPEQASLDQLLESCNYQQDAPTSVQVASLHHAPRPDFRDFTISTELNEDWLMVFCRLTGTADHYLPIMTRLLKNIVPFTGYASLYKDGEIIAVGLGVVDRNYIGLFDIITAEAYRNQGIGTQLLLHILQWGKANGATQAYLSVMRNNAPALKLYSKLGFEEVYGYWYRVKK